MHIPNLHLSADLQASNESLLHRFLMDISAAIIFKSELGFPLLDSATIIAVAVTISIESQDNNYFYLVTDTANLRGHSCLIFVPPTPRLASVTSREVKKQLA